MKNFKNQNDCFSLLEQLIRTVRIIDFFTTRIIEEINRIQNIFFGKNMHLRSYFIANYNKYDCSSGFKKETMILKKNRFKILNPI